MDGRRERERRFLGPRSVATGGLLRLAAELRGVEGVSLAIVPISELGGDFAGLTAHSSEGRGEREVLCLEIRLDDDGAYEKLADAIERVSGGETARS